jgi:hypothetical protein
MKDCRDVLIIITLLISATYSGISQPLPARPPMSPEQPSQPIGAESVPNLPLPIRSRDSNQLFEEYQRVRQERIRLEKELNSTMKDIAKCKAKIRTSRTGFGKWLAKRDLQQKVDLLDDVYTRLDNNDDRLRALHEIARNRVMDLPPFPQDPNLPPRFPRQSLPLPPERERVQPYFHIPGETLRPSLPPYRVPGGEMERIIEATPRRGPVQPNRRDSIYQRPDRNRQR